MKKRMVKFIVILVLGIVMLFGMTINNYYKLNKKITAFSYFSIDIYEAYVNYFFTRGRTPEDGDEFLKYMEILSEQRFGSAENVPNFIKMNGLYIEKDNDYVCIFTTNQEKYKKNKFNIESDFQEINNMSYVDYMLKPKKFILLKIKNYKHCDFDIKGIYFYKNTYLVTNNDLEQKLYYETYLLKKYLPQKCTKRFFIKANRENEKFIFLVLCKEDTINYDNILQKTDSLFNTLKISEKIDEIIIPFEK